LREILKLNYRILKRLKILMSQISLLDGRKKITTSLSSKISCPLANLSQAELQL
jgi:hypothetical protein